MGSPAEILSAFFRSAAKDSRIGVSHIGLFATLVQMAMEQGMEKPLAAYGAQVMQTAKISSSATYHKMLRELADYGYIFYKPSYYKGLASSIYLYPVQSPDNH